MTTWHTILETARHTPSPHNTQPWRVRVVDDRRADLFIERRRMLPDEDTTNCFVLSAMGMFVEALSIVAANAGDRLEAGFVPLDLSLDLIPFAHLRLEKGAVPPAPYSNDLVLRRQTSRLHPNKRPVSPSVLDTLAAVAAAGGQRFDSTSDGPLIDRLLQVNVDAIVRDLNDPKYHDEIVRWFRFGKVHAARTQDGLSSRCMNMPAAEFLLAARMPWLMSTPVVGGLLRALYKRRVGPAHQVGFLSGSFFDPANAVSTGRCLLRFWLEMTRHGVTMHPFGNMVTNPTAHAWLVEQTGYKDAWLVFRFGYTSPAPRSHRLSVQDILLA